MKPSRTTYSDLLSIPGVGPSLEGKLRELGINTVTDLRGRDPEKMYRDLCDLKGKHVDRCVLYVFRCAVYYAGSSTHDPALLKWWNWKD
jgi:hypothetical protein